MAEVTHSMKAVNIEWDVDCQEDLAALPTEIEIPDGMVDEDEISDYLSDVTGFCHKSYILSKDTERLLGEEVPPCRFNLGDKVKIPYLYDCYKHNNEVGEVTWIHPYKFYPGGDINNHVWKYQMEITYPDGQSIMVDPHRKPSGLVSEVVLVEAAAQRSSLDSVILSAATRAAKTPSSAKDLSQER